MESERMSIGELAAAAGLSRRAVRFYVQQKLIPSPYGLGRGRHYDRSHLDRLNRIAQLQAAGHSLDGIRRILDGIPAADAPAVAVAPARPAARRAMSAQLWTRLELAEGIELQLDAARYNPDVEQLLAIRQAVRSILRLDAPTSQPDADDDTHIEP